MDDEIKVEGEEATPESDMPATEGEQEVPAATEGASEETDGAVA